MTSPTSGMRERMSMEGYSPPVLIEPSQPKRASLVAVGANPDAVEHTGAMIALMPTAADAERIAVPEGEPEDELHVTLLYLGQGDAFSDHARQALTGTIAAVVAAMEPVVADGFALSIFNPGETNERETCIVLGLAGDGLCPIHDVIANASANLLGITGPELPDQHEPWLAHLTLIYTDNVGQIASLTDRVGPVTFDRVRIAFAGDYIDIPLSGK